MSKEAIALLEEILNPLDAYEPQCKLNLNPEKIRQALAILKQPKDQQPTSLGNTIRKIADDAKLSKTDKNIIHQAAGRLDVWWAYIGELKQQRKDLVDACNVGLGIAKWTKDARNIPELFKKDIELMEAVIAKAEKEG